MLPGRSRWSLVTGLRPSDELARGRRGAGSGSVATTGATGTRPTFAVLNLPAYRTICQPSSTLGGWWFSIVDGTVVAAIVRLQMQM